MRQGKQWIKEMRFAVLRMHAERVGERGGGPLNEQEEALYELIRRLECLITPQDSRR